MYKCKYCGKEFEKAYQLAAHISNCRLNPKYKENVLKRQRKKSAKEVMETRIKLNPYKYEKKKRIVQCQNCGKEYEIEITDKQFDNGKYSKFCCRSCANVRHHSDETKQKIGQGVKNSEKYLLGNSIGKNCINCFNSIDEIRQTKCIICGKYFIQPYKFNGLYYKISNFTTICSKECKSKYYSIRNKLFGTGGFRENSAKNFKYGWYKGYRCDSSWELAFIIYNLDHNIKVERCKEVRKYILNGEEHKFYPDFVIDNKIYEIKGIKNDESIAKQEYNKDIVFLYYEQMKQYLDYVIDKYGKNFIELYEDKNNMGIVV